MLVDQHIKVEEWDDWIRVSDEESGEIIHEGHSLAPFHWKHILSHYGVKVNIEYFEDDNYPEGVEDE